MHNLHWLTEKYTRLIYGAFLCSAQNDIFCPALCIYRSTVHSYLISFCTLLQSLYDITPEFTVCLLPQSGRKLVARKKTDRFAAFVSWENWAVYVRVSVRMSLVFQTHKKNTPSVLRDHRAGCHGNAAGSSSSSHQWAPAICYRGKPGLLPRRRGCVAQLRWRVDSAWLLLQVKDCGENILCVLLVYGGDIDLLIEIFV